MGAEAMRRALADAGIGYDAVQEAYVGYVYGDSTCGQTALYEVGMTGIPVVNVNNNCSTGSTALYLARKAIASGDADCVLALGFEQMQAGALKSHWDDRPPTRERFLPVLRGLTADMDDMPQAMRTFGGAGREYMQRYGRSMETFAAVRAKASRHAANNPLALFRKVVTTEDVMNDKVMLPGVMTRLMACPPTCGGAAALLVSERFAKKHGLRTDVQILAQAMTTDPVRILRAALDAQLGRHPHDAGRREPGLREGRRRPRGHRRVRAARLLRAERSASATRRWASAPKAAPRSSSTTATTPTAARSWSTRRAACCPRATRWARPAWRSATS